MLNRPNLAILIPCLNEDKTISEVVKGFRSTFPEAEIHVCDNGSTDNTFKCAKTSGAIVTQHPQIGKGNAVRRMFADIEADYYVLSDGDATYDPHEALSLIKKLEDDGLDMVVGRRNAGKELPRHNMGNRLFNVLYRKLFSPDFSDIFSGYRAFSRRYVKSFPAVSSGFEIETEMSVHASQLRLPCAEVDISYRDRIEGSDSKLHMFSDGFRVLKAMFSLLKDNRPVLLFGWLGTGFLTSALLLGIPLVVDFAQTGLVERQPTALLATGLAIISLVQFALGFLLESVARGRVELKRLIYLQTR